MFAGLTGWHLLIILAVILLLFGATRLPGLAKGLGQSMRVFKSEVKSMHEDDNDGKDATAKSVTDAEKTSATETSSQPKP